MSIRSTKNGSTPIFYYSKVGASSLNVVNQSLDTIYELPKVAPTENGQVIAVNTDGSSSFVSNDANPNALVTDTPLIVSTKGSVIVSDGLTSTGTNTSEDLIIRDYGVIDVYKQLNCNDVLNIQSLTTSPVTMSSGVDDFTINNTQGSRTVFINSGSYFFDNNIETSQNVILNQGKSLTLNNDTDVDNIKLYKANGALGSFVLDNQSGSKTDFKGASSYLFDNDVSIGDNTTSKKLYLNNVEITPSGSGGVSAGMLRALSLNLIVPTVAQTYDIIWSNLTAGEQLLWKGGDAATADPISSATGNYWSFVKTAGTSKINWTPPIDLSSLSFQDLQSVWAIIRINTTTGNLATEGSLWFQIQSNNDPANPPAYRTRWNYSNAATPNSQTGYFIKIFALDTIPLSTSASNTGKGQESTQVKFKTNPCDIEPTLFSLGLNKFVISPSGDISTSGYTLAPVQSVGINTASNILSYNFDVIAFGVNSYRWNLFFA